MYAECKVLVLLGKTNYSNLIGTIRLCTVPIRDKEGKSITSIIRTDP